MTFTSLLLVDSEYISTLPLCGVYWIGLVLVLGVYVIYVQSLRFRRLNELYRLYGSKFEDGMLTPEDAQDIVFKSRRLELPSVTEIGAVLGLYRTFAMPSVSSLLVATREVKDSATVGKRFVDTLLLITNFLTCPLSGFVMDPCVMFGTGEKGEQDPRGAIALARTNWIHSHYKISNEDYLHTLGCLCLGTQTTAKKYGWREYSPLELYANYILWAEIGRRMGIKNIPGSPEELEAWVEQYEIKKMVPAMTNKRLSDSFLDKQVEGYTERFGIRRFVKGMYVCMMDERLRIAMMLPVQPWYIHLYVQFRLRSASFVQRWFMLPRSDDNPRCMVSRRLPSQHAVNPTARKSLFSRLWSKPTPKTINGYRIEELGPLRFKDEGHEEVMKMASEMIGCPVTGPWSMEGRKQPVN